MTPRHLKILQHTLGVNEFGQIPRGLRDFTRNYFCAGEADKPICQSLIDLGYMQAHATTEWLPYLNCSVTPEGIAAMRRESQKPPKVSREKKRYLEFLDFSDAYDCTFREWLEIRKTDWYKKMKES